MIKHPITHATWGMDSMQYFDLKWNEVIDEKCVQPNAIDVRANQLFEFDHVKLGFITETIGNQHLQTKHLVSNYQSHGDAEMFGWWLKPGYAYQFQSKVFIEVPEGMAGWLISRSSLNRNGVFVQSGLYDSGFAGYIAGTLYPQNTIFLEQNTRVAQFVMCEAEMLHKYNGQYQTKVN